MTLKEAQERNSKIMQFRGMYHRINDCITEDILNKLDNNDINILKRSNDIYKDVIELMNESAGCRHTYFDNNICNYCGHKNTLEINLEKEHIMNLKELENIAYEIATQNITNEKLKKDKWEECSTKDILWEPLAHLECEFTEQLVYDISHDIINKFKYLCSDYNE